MGHLTKNAPHIVFFFPQFLEFFDYWQEPCHIKLAAELLPKGQNTPEANDHHFGPQGGS
jgi:hypothetical protein